MNPGKLFGWGSAPVPLLPESLRVLWSKELVPDWACTDLGLPKGSKLGDLSSLLWTKCSVAPPRVSRFVSNWVHFRSREIFSVPVFYGAVPKGFRFDDVPMTVRTRNCLRNGGFLKDPSGLTTVRFGELFSLRSMGVASVLDFACSVEACIEAGSSIPEQSFNYGMTTEILEPIAHQISVHDRRFADLLATLPGRLEQYLDDPGGDEKPEGVERRRVVGVLEALADRVSRISSLPLDTALRQLVEASTGLKGTRLDALCARLGVDGLPPVTLAEAAGTIGVTRERIRQIEKRFLERAPQHEVFMPALDAALDVLTQLSPMPVQDAADLLFERGIAGRPFSPESVQLAAGFCNRATVEIVRKIDGRSWICGEASARNSVTVLSFARAQAGASGASNVSEVQEELAARKKLRVSEQEIRDVLMNSVDFEFLEGDWFWWKAGKDERNRLRNATRKILSVVSAVELSSVREGIRRIYRSRGSRGASTWPLNVPPRSVMGAFYSRHPEFQISGDFVALVRPLDYREELTSTEQTFVEVLRLSGGGVMDRSTLGRHCCDERNMNPYTFSQYLTFSPIICHLGTDLWSLRGVQVHPGAVDSLVRASAEKIPGRRVVDYGWSPSGALWVAVTVPDFFEHATITIPAAVRKVVASREFQGTDEAGVAVGTVKINEMGKCYGFPRFIRRRGADAGDLLMMEFTLGTSSVRMQLIGEEALESFDFGSE